jgi:predicted GNAT superfamily acetyltransferase
MRGSMNDDDILTIAPSDVETTATIGPSLLALNNAHARDLSWLEPDRFFGLVGQAFLARRIGRADAFLLGFDQDADYDSPNFLWFRARYERFVYVDRIVVAPWARGRGHARRLYADLFRHAALAGHERIVCEINADPPNVASDELHARQGFVVVGSAKLPDSGKTVRYFSRRLSRPTLPTS